MADYKEMYYELFVEVANVIERLQKVQQKTEMMYATADGGDLVFGPNVDEQEGDE
ncbi:MAG: hypothetical protein FWE69_00195 [Clostridiales bacterium]|nr:hypothetical protein [Clostridiales bacterium]